MWVDNQIEVPGSPGERDSLNLPAIIIPADWSAYGASIIRAKEEGTLEIRISSGIGPNLAYIVICHSESNDASAAVTILDTDKNAFGFAVSLSTLRQLRGALDAAIAAAES